MKKNIVVLSACLALGTVVSVNSVEKKTEKVPTAKVAAAQEPKAKMMEEWQKIASPNERHQVLDVLIGDWEHSGQAWMTPQGKPEEFKGINSNQWILGKRFVQQIAKGQMMGMPFEGIGITGYDNMKGEYTSIWLGNMSTSMMKASAQYDPEVKTFSEKGIMACPMTGEKDRAFHAAWKILDQDHYTYEMFMTGPDGKEFKNMEIKYQRAALTPTAPQK